MRTLIARAWYATTATALWTVRHTRVSLPGLQVAALFFCISVTPSLLPRTWVVQGLISGFSASAGYAIGVFGAWVGGRVAPERLRMSNWMPSTGRPALTLFSLGLVVAFLHQGSVWQRDLYSLMDAKVAGGPSYLGVLLLTIVLLAALIGIARGLREVSGLLTRMLRRWIPLMAAQMTGVSLVVILIGGLVDGVVVDGLLSVASSTSAQLNDTQGTHAAPPRSPSRSGSPASLVSWDSLGMQGRKFVSGQPTLAELRRFGGASAREPIRAYVGLQSAPSIAARAELAVRELERTDAFSRAVLCVVTTTGTGWVDPYVAAGLEFMFNGDTAIVGMQYSYLPSWISFATERERVRQAARELFTRVHARWAKLPAGDRPRLILFGESLGSLGSESAFADLAEVLEQTDGALWAGPTSDNPLWTDIVSNRDPGSTEVLPVYQQGRHVRFASDPADLDVPSGEWAQPRVVYLQNPSDPVTLWAPRLAVQRPDWLREPPGRDVLPQMRWFPVVTFLQVSADLLLAEHAPLGHGHEFHHTAVAGLAGVTQPPQWSKQRSEELTWLLDGIPQLQRDA